LNGHRFLQILRSGGHAKVLHVGRQRNLQFTSRIGRKNNGCARDALNRSNRGRALGRGYRLRRCQRARGRHHRGTQSEQETRTTCPSKGLADSSPQHVHSNLPAEISLSSLLRGECTQGSGVNSHPQGSESVALKLRREVRDEALHLFSVAVPVLNRLTFVNRCRRHRVLQSSYRSSS
jgi:hypothetical protein